MLVAIPQPYPLSVYVSPSVLWIWGLTLLSEYLSHELVITLCSHLVTCYYSSTLSHPPPPPPPLSPPPLFLSSFQSQQQWYTVNNNNNNHHHIQRRYSRFSTISSQRRELSPTRTLEWPRRNHVQITCYTSSAYHVQVSWCTLMSGITTLNLDWTSFQVQPWVQLQTTALTFTTSQTQSCTK